MTRDQAMTFRLRYSYFLLFIGTLLLSAAFKRVWRGQETASAPPQVHRRQLPFEYHEEEPANKAYVPNATLGFQRIFAINLASRKDRRDQLSLMASISDLNLTFVDGVHISSRRQTHKGFPKHSGKMPLGKLGCYRAHANVWMRIIEERLTSALILEDDVDWDEEVKAALGRLQAPLQLLQAALDPYKVAQVSDLEAVGMPSWDLLRLGTCLDPAHTLASHRSKVILSEPPFVLYRDSTATPRELTSFEHTATLDAYGVPSKTLAEQTSSDGSHDEKDRQAYRIIQQSNYPVCLHAYAVSTRGAAKLLELTSQGFIEDANDLTVARLTQEGMLDSYTVIPSIFGQYKVQGWDGNSDINPLHAVSLFSRWKRWKSSQSAWQTLRIGYAWNVGKSVRSKALDLLSHS